MTAAARPRKPTETPRDLAETPRDLTETAREVAETPREVAETAPGDAAPWWEGAVVYQVYLRSFQDSGTDGVGDLAGLRARLPYLAWLGVDAVWVTPFFRSPMRDFGYDVAGGTEVDPLFGTLADVDALLADAHRMGLRVIVDWIPNHTSDLHPWFAASRAARDGPMRDWYVWRPSAPPTGPDDRRSPDERPPNAWPSAFGGPAWTYDAASAEWYLHLCLPEMPDLNWHAPAVEAAMVDVAAFWLDRGVDGLRVDVAHWIGKHPEVPDNPPAPPPGTEGAAFVNAAKPPTPFDAVEHRYDMDGPLAHAVYRRLRRRLDAFEPPRVAFGEIHLTGARWAAYAGTAGAPELHAPLWFGLLSVPFEADALRAAVEERERTLPAHATATLVLGNHDEPRLAARVGPERVRLAAMLLLTLRGAPFLYQGDELGLTAADFAGGGLADAASSDPLGQRLPGQGRDAARTPMPWTSAHPGGGFTGAPAPWLPLARDAFQGPGATGPTSVAGQSADRRSLLALYRRLLVLRRRTPALRWGAYATLDAPAGVFAYRRGEGAGSVVVALNASPLPVAFGAEGHARLLVATGPGVHRRSAQGTLPPWTLPPWTGALWGA